MSNPELEINSIVNSAEAARQEYGWFKSCGILREGLQIYPNSILLMAKLGKALRLSYKFTEAEQILRQAESIDNSDYEVLYQLGIVLRIEGKIWDALEVHQRLIDQFPTDANAQHIYANDQTVLGVPDKSIVTLEQLISQYPERMNYRVSYGNALNKMGRYTESITVINEVLEDNPYVVDAILALAEANMGLMQTQNWIAAATQAYQLNPENPVVNLWMHDVYLHTGELEESFKYLQQSLTIQPNFFLAHIAMGNFYWQTQQEDLAHKWLESASVIASWSGHAQGMLAQFMAETGRGKLNWKLLENEALALPYGRLPYHLENSIKKMIH